MTGAAVAVRAAGPASPVGPAASHVFGQDRHIEGQAARLAELIDPSFLANCGWDVAGQVIAPPSGHPLLGWQEPSSRGSGPIGCLVPGCQRDVGSHGLCRAHRAGQRLQGVSVQQYAASPTRRALDRLGPCRVAACPRDRCGGQVDYCEAHQTRWLRQRRAEPGLDELVWRATASPIVLTGQVSLAGLPALVTAQVLYGIQQRTRSGVRTRIEVLRIVVERLRRARAEGVDRLAEHPPEEMNKETRTVLGALSWHARLALAGPEDEQVKDVWELAVFGLRGRLTFTAISQPWLREAVKLWASDEMPRHRGDGAGRVMRSLVGSMTHLSQSLRAHREDQGDYPTTLGRKDIESFLHRLTFLAQAGTCSPDTRVRTCRDVKRMLARIRALGLTRPGGPAAGLGEDFILASGDIPAEPERGEPGRDLPAPVMRHLVTQLPRLEAGPSGREVRLAIELLMDTGRRPNEILRLRFDCLSHDPDGAPVLVYDNHKRYRPGRRLPISQATAELITAQQARVRQRFPDTPLSELVLLPTPHANPEGRRPISGGLLDLRHREWVDQGPTIRLDQDAEFDTSRIVPYAYRHTYAQRHADAAVPIDVLSELLDHRTLEVTRRYYRVGQERRRAAVDTVTTLSFDRHGNRIWRDAQTLLDSEHARYAVGEVAVPYGRCAEPSNVKAGGGACPVRFRCAGCDHFRTDIASLPDLTGYLDDLLATRERLAAAVDGIDEWARTDATPTEEEITRIRRLINRIKSDVAGLEQHERTQIDDAVTVVRRHRAAHPVTLGIPTLRATTPAPLTPTTAEAPA